MNECTPKYEPGKDLTGAVSQAGGVLGKRLLALKGDKHGVEAVSDDTSGGNVVVGYPARGGRHFGVSGYDADDTKLVKVVRGNGKVVPITAAANIGWDVEVMSTADGRVEPLDTVAVAGARAVGRTIRSVATGVDALVELY